MNFCQSQNGLKNTPADVIINADGDKMINTGASGAIPRNDKARMEKHAKLYYEEIRKRTGDIDSIAKNTGFSVEDIARVKAHLFINYYDLGGVEPERFDADYDIAVSWQRMIEGRNIKEMDMVLLRHELLEFEFMNEKGLPYGEAHKESEKFHNYIQYVTELNLKEGVK